MEIVAICKRLVIATNDDAEDPSFSGIQCEFFEFMPPDLALSFARCFFFGFRMVKKILEHLQVAEPGKLLAESLSGAVAAEVNFSNALGLSRPRGEAILEAVRTCDLDEVYRLLKEAGPNWPIMDPKDLVSRLHYLISYRFWCLYSILLLFL